MSGSISSGPHEPGADSKPDVSSPVRARRWPLLTAVSALVMLTVSALVIAGLNVWQVRTNQALNAELSHVTLQKAQKEAEQRALLLGKAQNFCQRANLATPESIEGYISEYNGTGTNITHLIDKECPDTSNLIKNWYDFDAKVQSTFSAGRCNQDGWAISATLDGSIWNPLSFPITVTVDGQVRSGEDTIASGSDRLFNVQPGESRNVDVYVATDGQTLDACTFTRVTWWPAG